MGKNKKQLITYLILVLIGLISASVFNFHVEDFSSALANLIARVKVERARYLTDTEISDLVKVVNNLTKDKDENGITYASNYYSKNLKAQIENYLKIHQKSLFGLDTSESVISGILQQRYADILPLVSIDKINIIKAMQERGVRKIIEKFEDEIGEQKFLMFRCVAFVKENGWKVQSAEISNMNPTDVTAAFANVKKNCYLKHPKAPKISKTKFYEINAEYSSEFPFIVYLNNTLILKGGIGGGILPLKLPLKKGRNKLFVILGASQKNQFEKNDPMIDIINEISGFSLSFSTESKKTVDIKTNKGNRSLKKSFTRKKVVSE